MYIITVWYFLPLGVISELNSHILIVGDAFLHLEDSLLEGGKVKHLFVLIGLGAAGNDTMDFLGAVGLLQHIGQLALAAVESRHQPPQHYLY